MKILTPCFDPLERREIVALVWVATGDGVRLEKKIRVIIKKQFFENCSCAKMVLGL